MIDYLGNYKYEHYFLAEVLTAAVWQHTGTGRRTLPDQFAAILSSLGFRWKDGRVFVRGRAAPSPRPGRNGSPLRQLGGPPWQLRARTEVGFKSHRTPLGVSCIASSERGTEIIRGMHAEWYIGPGCPLEGSRDSESELEPESLKLPRLRFRNVY